MATVFAILFTIGYFIGFATKDLVRGLFRAFASTVELGVAP